MRGHQTVMDTMIIYFHSRSMSHNLNTSEFLTGGDKKCLKQILLATAGTAISMVNHNPSMSMYGQLKQYLLVAIFTRLPAEPSFGDDFFWKIKTYRSNGSYK